MIKHRDWHRVEMSTKDSVNDKNAEIPDNGKGSSLKQSKKRGGPEKGRNNIATVSVAKKQYGIRHQAESAGKSSLKM